jgi:IclR family KDG regulon transcriptional repressor
MATTVKPPVRSPGIQSVSKALELLCCFSPDHPEWGVTEVADYLGLCKSAAHRILATCEEYHFVVRTSSRRYRLGSRALDLGNIYRFDRRMLWKAELPLRQLADQTESVAHIGELDGRDVLELLRSSGPGAVVFTPRPRLRGSAHATAMGKILLAFGGEAVFSHFVGLRRTFTQFTPHTIVAPEALKKELEVVASQGYAISDQEAVLGCRCVAVPIRSRRRNLVAALSVSNTQEKFCEREIPSLLIKLFNSAESIGREVLD